MCIFAIVFVRVGLRVYENNVCPTPHFPSNLKIKPINILN